MRCLPSSRANDDGTRLVECAVNEDFPVAAINPGHLDSAVTCIDPEDLVTHPVVRKTLDHVQVLRRYDLSGHVLSSQAKHLQKINNSCNSKRSEIWRNETVSVKWYWSCSFLQLKKQTSKYFFFQFHAL